MTPDSMLSYQRPHGQDFGVLGGARFSPDGKQVAGVWTAGMDGQNLKRLSDAIFVGILGKQP